MHNAVLWDSFIVVNPFFYDRKSIYVAIVRDYYRILVINENVCLFVFMIL